MTNTDHPADAHAWLATGTMRTASDALMGCVLLLAGAIAMWDGRGASLGRDEGPDAAFFPWAIGIMAVMIGILLLGRSALFRRPQPAPWKLRHLAIIVAAIVAGLLAAWQWGLSLLLHFGPAEHAALIALVLMTAIVLARWSRLRAIGMTLLGLLLSVVGIDVITGQPRLTMGLEPLSDGIATPFVVLGLLVIGDGLVCFVSPALWRATYAWLRSRPRQPEWPRLATIAARILAALAVAAACYVAFIFNNDTFDIGLVLAIGLFGVICKLFGWNRLVLIMACLYGNTFEQSLRQSMLLSQGDPAVFFQRPISAALLAAALSLAVLAIVLATRSSLLRHRSAPAAS